MVGVGPAADGFIDFSSGDIPLKPQAGAGDTEVPENFPVLPKKNSTIPGRIKPGRKTIEGKGKRKILLVNL